jgi:hypothetical protein
MLILNLFLSLEVVVGILENDFFHLIIMLQAYLVYLQVFCFFKLIEYFILLNTLYLDSITIAFSFELPLG